jgi:anaerobic magnesium-protoporphyrin IX monomethyl ester cyclase
MQKYFYATGRNMKILLLEHPRSINPERCNDIANTPLSSCLISGYAAGMLKQRGHDVEIIEGHMDNISYPQILKKTRDFKPDFLGVHMVYHWKPDSELYAYLENVKEELNPHISVYGFYPTISFEDILRSCGSVDSVVLGEVEATIVELAEAAAAGKDLAKVKGTAVRSSSGSVHHARREPVTDLDALPFPVRTQGMYRIPEVNIQGSRGCYGGCVFCYINPFYGRSGWRGRSPENIAEEIGMIISETGRKDFYFTDPNFFGSGPGGQKRASHLASLLKPGGIRFGIEGRVNDIHDETIEALVDAGLRNILIGIESGKDGSLKRMNKMTTVAQNENALRILRKHGIEPNVGFIMFEPDSSLEDLRTNFEFLGRNGLLERLPITTNVLYHFQIVLKGTPAYQKLLQTGRLETSPSSPYEGTASFLHPDVGLLASAMREITNFLFMRMNDVWSGKVMDPVGAGEKYAKVNRLLVDTFESILKAMEKGSMQEKEINRIVQNTVSSMNGVLNGKKACN